MIDMLLRDDKHLPLPHWLNVHEREHVVVLIDFARIELSGYDPAEDTACHVAHSSKAAKLTSQRSTELRFFTTLLLTVVILCGVIGSAVAQKKNTIMGDIVIGELTGKDGATREITVKYPGKQGAEIFNGILADKPKLKTIDTPPRDLELNEIALGMRVRVFYKTEKVNGQKINTISRLEVLGNDEFSRLRNQLQLDPSTPIVHAEKDDLPAASPLKVYLSVPQEQVREQLVAWLGKWNHKNGYAYGKLELVSELDQADLSIVVARGSDSMVGMFPIQALYGSRTVDGVMSHATSYLVAKEDGRLKLLWTKVAAVFSDPKVEVSPKTTETLIDEVEKRMRTRGRNQKK